MSLTEFVQLPQADGTIVYWYKPTGEFSLAASYESPRFQTQELAHQAALEAATAPTINGDDNARHLGE